MGDRCYMQITCREADKHLFEDLFTESYEPENGLITLAKCEANYAYSVSDMDFGDLPEGVPFYGSHSAGDEYGSGSFATDGVTMRYVEQIDWTYGVRFDRETGEPNAKDIEAVKSYIFFEKKVREILAAKEVAA